MLNSALSLPPGGPTMPIDHRSPEVTPVFDSSIYANSYDIWRDKGPGNGNHQESSAYSTSNCHGPKKGFRDRWVGMGDIDMDQDITFYDDYAQIFQQDTESVWPVWGTSSYPASSIPISTARSPLRHSPQNTPSMRWHTNHHSRELFDDAYGFQQRLHSGAPPNTSVYAEGGYLPCLATSSKQSYSSQDYSKSPHSYPFPASSPSGLSPIPTVSPLSASSASPTPPTLSPDLIIHTPPIPLHQPRPERPIPIIPLSMLAFACEESLIPPFYSKPSLSSELLELSSSPMQCIYTSSSRMTPLLERSTVSSQFTYKKTHDNIPLAVNDARHVQYKCMKSYNYAS